MLILCVLAHQMDSDPGQETIATTVNDSRLEAGFRESLKVNRAGRINPRPLLSSTRTLPNVPVSVLTVLAGRSFYHARDPHKGSRIRATLR